MKNVLKYVHPGGGALQMLFRKFFRNNLVYLVFVFWVVFTVQYKMITNSLPYSNHVDEGAIFSRAIIIMKTGDFNPHFFNYPSLPIYLATFGTTLGFFKSASNLEIKKLSELSPQVYPYFSRCLKKPFIKFYPKIFSILTLD